MNQDYPKMKSASHYNITLICIFVCCMSTRYVASEILRNSFDYGPHIVRFARFQQNSRQMPNCAVTYQIEVKVSLHWGLPIYISVSREVLVLSSCSDYRHYIHLRSCRTNSATLPCLRNIVYTTIKHVCMSKSKLLYD
jgi:hypothetical protein